MPCLRPALLVLLALIPAALAPLAAGEAKPRKAAAPTAIRIRKAPSSGQRASP